MCNCNRWLCLCEWVCECESSESWKPRANGANTYAYASQPRCRRHRPAGVTKTEKQASFKAGHAAREEGENCWTSRITSNFSLSMLRVDPDSCFCRLFFCQGRRYPDRSTVGREFHTEDMRSSLLSPWPKCWSKRREVRIGKSISSHQSRNIRGTTDI